MPATPTLTTDRLILRPRTVADLSAQLTMDCDPAVRRFIPGLPDDPAVIAARLADMQAADATSPGAYWAVAERGEPDRMIGVVFLHPFLETDDLELGYRYQPAVWGRGYAREAARAAKDYGFAGLNLPRQVGVTHPDNHASAAVLTGVGFVESGMIPYRSLMTRYFILNAPA